MLLRCFNNDTAARMRILRKFLAIREDAAQK